MRSWKKGYATLLAGMMIAGSAVAFAAPVAAQEGDCTIAVSWREFQEERWALRDKPSIVAVADAAGCDYIESDAGNSPEKQFADIEQLITQGADAILVLAADPATFGPAIDLAEAEGVHIIAYDQLIGSPDDLALQGPILGPQREVRTVTARAVADIFAGADVQTALSGAAQQANALIADYNARN